MGWVTLEPTPTTAALIAQLRAGYAEMAQAKAVPVGHEKHPLSHECGYPVGEAPQEGYGTSSRNLNRLYWSNPEVPFRRSPDETVQLWESQSGGIDLKFLIWLIRRSFACSAMPFALAKQLVTAMGSFVMFMLHFESALTNH